MKQNTPLKIMLNVIIANVYDAQTKFKRKGYVCTITPFEWCIMCMTGEIHFCHTTRELETSPSLK